MLSVDVTIPVICLILLMISACEKAEDDLKTSFSENHQKDEKHVCSLYIYSDPFLWRQVYLLEEKNATATYQRIEHMIKSSVKEANRIYNMAEFYGKGRTIHSGIKFALSDYFIDTDEHCGPKRKQTPWNFHEMDCTEPDLPMVDICKFKPNCRLKGNVFCNDIRSMRFFLHAFSAMRHDKHCLAFAFTYREMTDFQGIAWIKGHNPNDTRTLDHFGYCAKDDAKRCQTSDPSIDAKAWPPTYFRNTGVVNFHLIRGVLSEKSAMHIFIHELGHSLGAKHDDESEECVNMTDEDFLMTGDAKKIVLGQTSEHFSPCSSLKIGLNLDRSTCWSERKGAKKRCNNERTLKSHRECLDNLTQKDAITLESSTGMYAGMAIVMLILSLFACCLLGLYLRGRLLNNGGGGGQLHHKNAPPTTLHVIKSKSNNSSATTMPKNYNGHHYFSSHSNYNGLASYAPITTSTTTPKGGHNWLVLEQEDDSQTTAPVNTV